MNRTYPKPADPKPCRYCGEIVPNPEGYTSPLLFHSECHIKAQFEKAEEVDEASTKGMFFDPHTDRFESDSEMIMDYYYAVGTPIEERPEFCFVCDPEVWKGVNLHRAIENELDDLYCSDDEYPTHKDIVDLKELEDFVEKWNAKQNITIYHPNYKKKVRLHWEKPE